MYEFPMVNTQKEDKIFIRKLNRQLITSTSNQYISSAMYLRSLIFPIEILEELNMINSQHVYQCMFKFTLNWSSFLI